MKFESFKKAALTIGLLTSPLIVSASDYSLSNILSSAIKSTNVDIENSNHLEHVVNQINDIEQSNNNLPNKNNTFENNISGEDIANNFAKLSDMINSSKRDNEAIESNVIKNLQGPNFINQKLDVDGEVIAIGAPFENKPCVQLRVLKDVVYSGGRVWVCDSSVSDLNLLEKVNISGKVTSSRLTRMGPHRRVIPIVTNPSVNKLK